MIVTRRLPKPKIDVATRWLSIYGMLKSLIELKDFCVELSQLNEKFKTDDGFWPQLTDLAHTLKYTNDAMTKLQAKTFGFFRRFFHFYCARSSITTTS